MRPPLAARLESWCRGRGHAVSRVEVLPGDVSPRRYCRLLLADGRYAVAAYYPATVRDAFARYLATTRLLVEAEVRVATILDVDEEAGWMLIEDLGNESLYQRGLSVPWSELDDLFRRSLAIRRRIVAIPPSRLGSLNPPLDRDLLARELAIAWDVFLEPRGLTSDPILASDLRSALAALCDALAASPQAVCHRDFMARNLMIAGDSLAVIDHQDLRIGPRTYDLASLLNDSLFAPSETEAVLLESGLTGSSRDDYYRAAAQRTLKALGTFARAATAGSKAHDPLIPPTLERAIACLGLAPETSEVAPAIGRLWAATALG